MGRNITQQFLLTALTLGLGASGATAAFAAKKPGKVCGTFEVTLIEKDSNGKWQEKKGTAKSCNGTAKWGSFGEGKNRQYQIITYFKIPEFKTNSKAGYARMNKSMGVADQDTMFFYSEAFPKAKWQSNWKVGDKVQTMSNILIAGKLYKVPTMVEITEKDGKRISNMTSTISRKALNMPDIDTDTFKINDTMTIKSVVPFAAVEGSL